MRKLIDLAAKGNIRAIGLCADRISSPRKDRPINLVLPPIQTLEQLPAANSAIVQAVADGQITPAEGELLANVRSLQHDFLSNIDLDRRVELLERALFPSAEEVAAREQATSDVVTEILHQGRARAAEAHRKAREGDHKMKQSRNGTAHPAPGASDARAPEREGEVREVDGTNSLGI